VRVLAERRDLIFVGREPAQLLLGHAVSALRGNHWALTQGRGLRCLHVEGVGQPK